MATEAQIDANRENAKASTGPRTEEGKAKSARNNYRFGLFATNNCVQPRKRKNTTTSATASGTNSCPSAPSKKSPPPNSSAAHGVSVAAPKPKRGSAIKLTETPLTGVRTENVRGIGS